MINNPALQDTITHTDWFNQCLMSLRFSSIWVKKPRRQCKTNVGSKIRHILRHTIDVLSIKDGLFSWWNHFYQWLDNHIYLLDNKSNWTVLTLDQSHLDSSVVRWYICYVGFWAEIWKDIIISISLHMLFPSFSILFWYYND